LLIVSDCDCTPMFVVLLPEVLFCPDPLLHHFRWREKLQMAPLASANSSTLSTVLQNRESSLIRHDGSHGIQGSAAVTWQPPLVLHA